MKDIVKPLSKGVIIPLVLTAATSATDAAIHKKMFGFGNMTLIMFNKEMNDIIKIDKSLEESGLLIKEVSETIKNEAKGKKRRISWDVIRQFRYWFLRESISR